MFIESTRKSGNRRTCVCGKGEECKAISKEFQDLQDIRGGFMKAPNPIKDTRKGFQKKTSEAWVRRMCAHLKIKQKEYEDTMCYNKVLDESRRNTRAANKVQKKKDAYIALWHFPPILLKEFQSSIPRTIPIQKAKDLQLYSSGGGLLYSRGDYIKDDAGNKHVLIVPAFVDITSIRTDLLQVPAASRDSQYTLKDANASISSTNKRNTPAAVLSGGNTSSGGNTTSGGGDTTNPPPKRRVKNYAKWTSFESLQNSW